MSIQIIEEAGRPKFAERAGKALMGGANLLAQYLGAQRKKELLQQQEQEELSAGKRLGLNLSGIPPESRKKAFELAFQQKFGGEEKREKKEKQRKDREIVGRVLRGEKVTPEEIFSLDPQLQISLNKTTTPKPPPGGTTAQPVPLEVSEAIKPILSVNKDATADELTEAFDSAGIPRIFSNTYIENRRRTEESLAKGKQEQERLDYQSFKDNKDYTDKVFGGFEAYKRDKLVLDQMDKIVKKGNLPKPLSVSLLNKLGIPLGVLENPDAEQFDKLSSELLKNIQGTFGNRILQSEVQQFMKSIPTLLNSTEGQEKLIKQWQVLNEAKKIYYDAYKDVKKRNPKRLPPDLHEQVLEEAEAKLDLLADEFKKMNEGGLIQMVAPDGSIINVPENDLEEALSLGAQRI